jgi:hypothetical protein
VFNFLQSRTDEEALSIFQRLRAGADVENIVRHVKDGDLLLQLSLLPESRFRFEFPYIKTMPSYIIQMAQNPYLESVLYENTFQHSLTNSSPAHIEPSESRHVVHIRTDSAAPNHLNSSFYTKPYQAAELVDPLLSDLKVSNWTTVSSDESLMKKLLQTYFLHLHCSVYCFHKDHFLRDMMSGRTRFCSSLLVNVILAYACCGYDQLPHRHRFWKTENLSYRFLAEAKRLWELQAGNVKITTIQAGMILHVTIGSQGMITRKDNFIRLAS